MLLRIILRLLVWMIFRILPKSQLLVKFLAYVAYFNLSVITRRQLRTSSQNVSEYENLLEDNEDVFDERSETQKKGEMETKFNLPFIVHKIKFLWPVITFFSWNMFTLLTICIIGLSIHWKLSISMILYYLILGFYYFIIPFGLQPKTNSNKYAHLKRNNEIGTT
jgi:ABC-type multidrug transport system fused ATPase/permease subunit